MPAATGPAGRRLTAGQKKNPSFGLGFFQGCSEICSSEPQIQVERTAVQPDAAANIGAATPKAHMSIEGGLHRFTIRTARRQNCKTDKSK